MQKENAVLRLISKNSGIQFPEIDLGFAPSGIQSGFEYLYKVLAMNNYEVTLYEIEKSEDNSFGAYQVYQSKNQEDYLVILKVNENEIQFYETESNSIQKISTSDFWENCSDYRLCLSTKQPSLDIGDKLKVKKIPVLDTLSIIGLFIIIGYSWCSDIIFGIINTFYFINLLVSVDLFRNQIQITNTKLDRLCHALKSSCHEEKSHSDKVYSLVGISAYGTVFCVFLLPHTSLGVVIPTTIAGIISVILVVQMILKKHFCMKCLIIHSGNLIVLILTHSHVSILTYEITTGLLLNFSCAILIGIILYFILLKLITIKHDSIRANTFIKSIEYDTQLFELLLKTSKKVTPFPNSIVFQGKFSIIRIDIVLNPYCKHCGKIISTIQKHLGYYLENGILFNLTIIPTKQINFNEVVNRFAKTNTYDHTLEMIKFWYNQEIPDAEKFIAHIQSTFQIQITRPEISYVEQVSKWMNSNSIEYSPFIAINNFEFPNKYFDNSHLHYYLTMLTS